MKDYNHNGKVDCWKIECVSILYTGVFLLPESVARLAIK